MAGSQRSSSSRVCPYPNICNLSTSAHMALSRCGQHRFSSVRDVTYEDCDVKMIVRIFMEMIEEMMARSIFLGVVVKNSSSRSSGQHERVGVTPTGNSRHASAGVDSTILLEHIES